MSNSFSSFSDVLFFSVLLAIIAAVLCKQTIVFVRALVFPLLLSTFTGLIFFIPSVLIQLLSGNEPEVVSPVSIMFFFAIMSGMSGYVPAMLTVVICDCLWVLWRVRYWFIPMGLGALFSTLFLPFLFDKGILEIGILSTVMGSIGGLLFVLLRRRFMPLADSQ